MRNRDVVPHDLQAATVAALMLLGILTSSTPRVYADSRMPDLPPVPQNQGAGENGHINFSFDQVDVTTFVKLVGEITGHKFVVSDGIKGKITVVSPKISRDQVYPLFVSILESVGCSIIEEENLCRVISLPERAIPAAPVMGPDEEIPAEGVVTRVIHLEHVSAREIRKLLESQVSGGKAGAVSATDETNHIIVTDTAQSVRRIEKIIAQIDRPGLMRMTEVVPLKFASAQDLAEQITQAVAESEGRAQQLRERLPAVPGSQAGYGQTAVAVASPHSNSLILVGTASQIASLKRLISEMDVDAPSGRGRLNAIFLKYIAAEEASKNLNALFDKSYAKEKPEPKARRIAIEASAANNALLVDATPGDYEIVKRLVEQLDQAPQQVHIGVMIAEHSVSEDINLGVEMAAVKMPAEKGSTVLQGSSKMNDGADSVMNAIQAGIFPRGITIGVAHGARIDNEGRVAAEFPGIINVDAIKKDGRFEILSETSLEAQNNREASVRIVNEIPILKSTIQGGSGASRDVIQNIERVDVGIKLKLTPHIIPGGEVQMALNPSIEAVIDPGPAETQFTPTIARREVATTVTVPDGKTIVIAGLTREDKTKIVKRVPVLGSIPLMGWLFRHTVDATKKTNLLIFVTPRIVTDIAAAENVMKEWKEKTGLRNNDKE